MPVQEKVARRLPPDVRRAHLLAAARVVLQRMGIERFSLDEVAREAGVAATLPSHYFGSRQGLLSAALCTAVDDVCEPLLREDRSLSLRDRLAEYIALVATERWGHALWMHGSSVSPETDAMLLEMRRRLIEVSMRKRWYAMTTSERLRGAGWVGYVSSAVALWLEDGSDDQQELLQVLLDAAERLHVGRT